MYKPTYHTLSKRGYITLLALLVSIITFAQGVTVKGTVLDENKEALIGATIQVKGENNGVAADLDGNFTLKVKKNAEIHKDRRAQQRQHGKQRPNSFHHSTP